MRFEIVSIFPDFFQGFLENGILRRAIQEGRVEVGIHDLRSFTHDRHRTVDDRPFGGGEGMVLKPQPIVEALTAMGIAPISERRQQEETERSEGREPKKTRVLLTSAQGPTFTQAMAREFSQADRVVLICGRYEGVDERINELYCDQEISIGDYVLSGGELAASVVIDATMRLIPGVLGNQASGEFESFGVADDEIVSDESGVPRSQHGSGGLLDYPHYTRPSEFEGVKVPEALLNGDHLQIRKWRREQQLRKTLKNRPDLLARTTLSKEDQKMLTKIRAELKK